jgi:transposase
LRPGKLNADPATLHELAAQEIDPRVRRRIRALACIAEGMSTYDAEAEARLGHASITNRVRRFQEEGVAGFGDRQPFGRPAKLTDAQLQELCSLILAKPHMSYTQLRDLVEARFCVRYSAQGLRRLLKKRLAIVWRHGRFSEAEVEVAVFDDRRQPPSPSLA